MCIRDRYWLRSSNEIAVRALFTDSFIDRLFSMDPEAKWYVEKSGRWLLVYAHGKTYPPQTLSSIWGMTRTMADLFLSTQY